MHREFEITVPPGRHRAVEFRVRVRAETWLEALAEAGRRLRAELGVTIAEDQTDRFERAIRVRELASGRQYVVSSLAGELPAAAPRSGAAGGRPTLLTPLAVPGEGATHVQPRVTVRSPRLRRRGAEGRGTSARVTQDATRVELQAVGARPPADRVQTPPEWRRRRAVVRSAQLKRRQPVLHVTTPGPATGGGMLFKPVTDLALLPGDVDSLIDAAVAMLADHIPCTFVQAALWLDDQVGLWVASAKGQLADEVRYAVLRLPPGLIPEGPSLEAPRTYVGDAVAFAYEDDVGGVLRADVDALLCAPIRVEGVPLGLFVLAGPERADGFSKPDVRGAMYLAKTVGARVAALLAGERDERRGGQDG